LWLLSIAYDKSSIRALPAAAPQIQANASAIAIQAAIAGAAGDLPLPADSCPPWSSALGSKATSNFD
jgi:hypothetical protein